MDSAAAMKCNNYRLESSLAGHLDKSSVHWRGAQYENVENSVPWDCTV